MKILLATDGSKYSDGATEKCCELFAKSENSSVKIISVVESPAPMAAEPFGISNEYYAAAQAVLNEQAREAVKRAEKTIIEKFINASLDVETATLAGNPKEEILEEAKKMEGGFDCSRLARIRVLGANAARFGVERGCASRAVFGFGGEK